MFHTLIKFGTIVDLTEIIRKKKFLKTHYFMKLWSFKKAIFACSALMHMLKISFKFHFLSL